MRKVADWRCTNGHVMGQVVRNGSNVRQLLLFREALTTSPQPSPSNGEGVGNFEQTEVDVMAVIEGYAADVRCSECGAVRTWVPGQEAIDRLVAQVEELRNGARL